jgi:hypothetical protein
VREIARRPRSHGLSRTPIYVAWRAMIYRCENPNASNFRWYGGRGIGVCARWRRSFAAFVADMAPRPEGLTLDRINGNGDYQPDNCRWATWGEQVRNRRVAANA